MLNACVCGISDREQERACVSGRELRLAAVRRRSRTVRQEG